MATGTPGVQGGGKPARRPVLLGGQPKGGGVSARPAAARTSTAMPLAAGYPAFWLPSFPILPLPPARSVSGSGCRRGRYSTG